MSPRPLNVLLLLSSAQKPDPFEQIDILEQESNKDLDGVTHFVTTRRCAGISITPKLSDPGAPKRRYVLVDRRNVQ